MTSYPVHSRLNGYCHRCLPLVVSAGFCLVAFKAFGANGDKPFFATNSSRASGFANEDRWRVTCGPSPKSTARKRPHPAEGKRSHKEVKPSEYAGLREFTDDMFTFTKFREFGYRQAGTSPVPGAVRRAGATRIPPPPAPQR
jgi:hypothetical protein